jgi:hypothetical protein
MNRASFTIRLDYPCVYHAVRTESFHAVLCDKIFEREGEEGKTQGCGSKLVSYLSGKYADQHRG